MKHLLFLCALCSSLPAASQPNVLVVIADDLGDADTRNLGEQAEQEFLAYQPSE